MQHLASSWYPACLCLPRCASKAQGTRQVERSSQRRYHPPDGKLSGNLAGKQQGPMLGYHGSATIMVAVPGSAKWLQPCASTMRRCLIPCLKPSPHQRKPGAGRSHGGGVKLRRLVNPVVRAARAEIGGSLFEREAGLPCVVACQVEGVDLDLLACVEN